jgi:hypothetical protein
MQAAIGSLAKMVPDIDAMIGPLVKGTSLLKGGASDYYLSVLIAIMFPVMRFILDGTVYNVSKHYFQISNFSCSTPHPY